MKLDHCFKILEQGENYIVSFSVNSNGVAELLIDNLIKFASGGQCRTSLAKIVKGTPHYRYIVWHGESYFDTTEYLYFEDFTANVYQRLKLKLDWAKLLKKFEEEYAKTLNDKTILKKALMLGQDNNFIRSLGQISLDRNNRIFASHQSAKLLLFIYKPENRIYAFQLTNNVEEKEQQKTLFEHFIKVHSDKTWCTCQDRSNIKHVKNHKGVSEGYICLKCKRFVQIG